MIEKDCESRVKQDCLKNSVDGLLSQVQALMARSNLADLPQTADKKRAQRPPTTPLRDCLLNCIEAIDEAHDDLRQLEKWIMDLRALTGID